MGIDLRLLSTDRPRANSEAVPFAHTVLSCEAEDRLFSAVRRLPAWPVSPEFTSYQARDAEGEACYGVVTADAYGKPLQWLPVEHLKSLARLAEESPVNRAIWAFLCALPDDYMIALYWH